MSLKNQLKIWALFALGVILLLYLFKSILLPFVVGMVLAYLLDPVADRLEKWKFNRFWATSSVIFIFLLFFVGAFFLLIPLLVQQSIGLAEKLPSYFSQLQALVNQYLPNIYSLVGKENVVQLEEQFTDILGQSIGVFGNVLKQIMQSGLTMLNLVGLLVITPVVTFYLLADWDNIIKRVDDLLPRDYREEIRGVFKNIDKAMSGVIRGQSSVVFLLAIFYATALTLTGLNFGLAIGLIAGLLSFIPYVGFLVGLLLSVGVALVQFWPDWIMVSAVFAIFIVGQFLEGNILYPKLVGKNIGIHPVWLMFALFACGLIFGFVGLLLAVPLVAIIGVLVRFSVAKYEKSTLYLGTKKPKKTVAKAKK